MKKVFSSKIAVAAMTFLIAAAPLFAQENQKVAITKAHEVYQEIGVEEDGIRVKAGQVAEVVEELEDYYKLRLQNDSVVYVEKEYTEIVKEEEQPEKETQEESAGEEVVEYAKQYIGTPYVYGGNSLGNGVDCSGFTSQVYKAFDVSLQRSSRDQYSSNGVKVKKSDLQPGDLVFYGYEGSITHVAIYAGNDKIVHASDTRGVVTDSMSLRGMPPIVGYKRVV